MVTLIVTGLPSLLYSAAGAFGSISLRGSHGMIFDIAVIGILLFWL